MGSGKIFLTSIGLFSCVTLASLPLFGQDQAIPVPQVENSRFQAEGVINANSVYVHSGAGENYYPTARLDKGAPVTVVGIRFDWLKIIPPEGSFSYVAKAHVEKRGDGSIGRVTANNLNIRAGSSLNPVKTAVQSQINEGEDVQILGEADEYFKIKPPAGAYLYVNKQYVDLVKTLGPAPSDGKTVNEIAKGPASGSDAAGAAKTTDGTAGVREVAAGATTQPAAEVSAAEAEFGKLETRFTEASAKELDQQPIAELLAGYQKVAKDDKLPETLKRIADYRVTALASRQSAQGALVEAKKIQAELDKRQNALKAEREELANRLKQQELNTYAAMGELRTSSLQQGAAVLFRITDPANGRTMVYIRSNDPKLGSMIGQFVGIRGEATLDPSLNLNVISPTAIEPLDTAKAATVTAQITPPSMLKPAETVSEIQKN